MAFSKIAATTLSDDIISGKTALAEAPADTDELLLSDAGTLKRIDYSHIKSTSDFKLLSMIDQDLGTASKIQFTQVFSSDYDYYRVIGCFFLGSNSAHDIEFRFLNSSDSEQTASEYYGVVQGWRYSTSANDRSDWGQWTASSLDIMRDVLGGAAWKKVSLDMLIFPDAYASTTYNSMIWNAGHMKYQGGTTAISSIQGNGIYAQTTDLSGGGIQLECSANSFDFVNMGIYGVKTTT